MSTITAVVSDFGGVLTSPLTDAFIATAGHFGVPVEDLFGAIAETSERLGVNPLYELETGRMTEREFIDALTEELTRRLGRPVTMDGFNHQLFAQLRPNEPMITLMAELAQRGYRMAICTNNVREWEAEWRAMLPVDEIFELVIDSAFVGLRKPDPEIYALTLERLGVTAAQTLFIDDIDVNCEGARAAGMQAILFETTDQAIAAIEESLRQ